MIDILLYWLGGMSLTHIVVDGKIFDVFRQWVLSEKDFLGVKAFIKDIIECYQCTGLWCGLLVGLLPFGWYGLSVLVGLFLFVYSSRLFKLHPLLQFGSLGVAMFVDPQLIFPILIGLSVSLLSMYSKLALDFVESKIVYEFPQ